MELNELTEEDLEGITIQDDDILDIGGNIGRNLPSQVDSLAPTTTSNNLNTRSIRHFPPYTAQRSVETLPDDITPAQMLLLMQSIQHVDENERTRHELPPIPVLPPIPEGDEEMNWDSVVMEDDDEIHVPTIRDEDFLARQRYNQAKFHEDAMRFNFGSTNNSTTSSPKKKKSKKVKQKKKKKEKSKKKDGKEKRKKKNLIVTSTLFRKERDEFKKIIGLNQGKIENLEKKNQYLETLVEVLQKHLQIQTQELAKQRTELLNYKYQNIQKEQKPEDLTSPDKIILPTFNNYKESATSLPSEKASIEKDQILLKVMHHSNDMQSIYFPLSIPSSELFQKLFLSFDLCLDEDEFDTFELVFGDGVSLGYNEEESLNFVFRKYFPNENITVSGSEVVFEAELKEIPLL